MNRTLRTLLIALAAVCFAIALFAPVSRFFENKSLDEGMDELRQMKRRAAEIVEEGLPGLEKGPVPSPDIGAPDVRMPETDQGLYSDRSAAVPSAEAKTALPEPVSGDAETDISGLSIASDAAEARQNGDKQTSVVSASPMPITDRSLVSGAPFTPETAPNGQGIAQIGTFPPAETPPSGAVAPVGTASLAGVQATPNPDIQTKTDQSLYQENLPSARAQGLLPTPSADSVIAAVSTAKLLPVLPGGSPSPTPAMPESTPVPSPSPTPFVFDEDNILPEYRELYEQNPDLVGWLRIDGTLIDYPVLQSDDEEFYLTRDFFGRSNYNGQLILDANCDPFLPSMNLVISGHNMKSGKMFGNLQAYASIKYAREHPTIAFDTLFRRGEYKLVAAFYTWDYTARPDGFQYNMNIEYRRQMTAFLRKLDEIKLYDTGVSVEFGDELIMLSTCSYQTGDGRFAVVAR